MLLAKLQHVHRERHSRGRVHSWLEVDECKVEGWTVYVPKGALLVQTIDPWLVSVGSFKRACRTNYRITRW